MTLLPLFKPGMVTLTDSISQPWSFTYLVDDVPHQSSHTFTNAVKAKAAMRRLVTSYNALYAEFK